MDEKTDGMMAEMLARVLESQSAASLVGTLAEMMVRVMACLSAASLVEMRVEMLSAASLVLMTGDMTVRMRDC
ncbi:hypothetical protein ACHAXM_000269 [Skeletonema potamos]